eukprot:CAMPEP_0170515886 /NCGR_PEP_ID=MMETSP0209-20121228/2272_1 /TAXON_ID=665100 ORGANISM="Litonotus pictus, Strain P1" /NCGR_SAMPLE_ID=MMETSP0209 /ASSEMBLY_ACC=CAM_ASM_000301 /LENGTH=347 /DNA_ID=CAMNT_0010800589 /DNA_START=84 /DNA_END=1127 /DNA_ORIENTATION=-
MALFVSGIVIIVTLFFYILMYSFTNFSSLDNLEEYSTEFTKNDKDIMSNVVLSAKIMPSYNFKENAVWLEPTRDISDTIIPGAEGISESLNLNNTFMRIEETKNNFPKFKYTEDNIPVGNSIKLCISLHWAHKEKGKNFDLTERVQGLPKCGEARSGKFIWNDDDPTHGVDVPAWTQHETDVDCTDQEDCQSTCEGYDALFLNAKRGKKCFGYKILESICLTVEFDAVKNTFTYKGGCFEGGQHYQMTNPVKDQIYYFDKVKFEVRNYNDPVIKAGVMSNYSYSFGASMNWLAYLLNFLFWVALIVFIAAVGMIFYYKSQLQQSGNNNLVNKDNKEDNENPIDNEDP